MLLSVQELENDQLKTALNNKTAQLNEAENDLIAVNKNNFFMLWCF